LVGGGHVVGVHHVFQHDFVRVAELLILVAVSIDQSLIVVIIIIILLLSLLVIKLFELFMHLFWVQLLQIYLLLIHSIGLICFNVF